MNSEVIYYGAIQDFKRDFDQSDVRHLEHETPHDIMDGLWGGWGQQEWYHGSNFGLPHGNVYYYKDKVLEDNKRISFLARCWDMNTKKWRFLTEEEYEIAPKGKIWKRREPIEFKNLVVAMPVIKKSMGSLTAQDFISVQPMNKESDIKFELKYKYNES